MEHYQQTTTELVTFLRNWVASAEHGNTNNGEYNFATAVHRKYCYNEHMNIINLPVESLYRNVLKTRFQGMEGPIGPTDGIREHRRRDEPQETNLNNTVFCIDDDHTVIRDDAISFNSESGEVTVYISDVARYFSPHNQANAGIRRTLLRGKSSYGIEGLQSMFPMNVATKTLSLGHSNETKDVLTASFNFRYRDGSSEMHVQLTDLSARTIQTPRLLTYREVEDMLTRDDVCGNNCGLPSCNICFAAHLRGLNDCVMEFRENRFYNGLSNNCYRQFTNPNDNCFVTLRRYGTGRNPWRIAISMNAKSAVHMPYTLARRLVEECMVASNCAIGNFFIEHRLPAIYKGRHGRGRNSEEGLHHESGMVYSWNSVRGAAVGIRACVPWTNPIRSATDYLNHVILRTVIQHSQMGDNGSIATAIYDRPAIHNALNDIQHYLGTNILTFCRTVSVRAHVIARLNANIRDTAVFHYFSVLCQSETQKSLSKRRRLRIHATDMERGVHGQLQGSIYLPRYGCTVHNFQLIYHPSFENNDPEQHIVQQRNLDLTVVLHDVQVEQWFLRLMVMQMQMQ